MKFDKPTSLATLAACAALATVFYLREPSELADNSGSEEVSGSVVDSRPSNSAPARPGPQYSTEALPVEEQAMLAELQRNFSPEELEEVFNPLTFDERRQMTFGPTDHLADAARRYERDWASFVDGLGLNTSDSRFVRDAWIEARALDTELSFAFGDDSHEDSAIIAAKDEAGNQLYSRLSQVLTPGQMEAFLDHREQLITDGIASNQADVDQMIANGHYGIISASDDKDLPTVQAYLASGVDPNRFTTDGNSAMREAARDNSPEILRALIAAGGDVNLPNYEGRSALRDAALNGSVDAARVLLDAGANPNYLRDPDNPLTGALNVAAQNGHTEVVRVLLDAGADATGISGEYALAHAIRFNDPEMEQMLVEAGAPTGARRVDESGIFISLGRRLGLLD